MPKTCSNTGSGGSGGGKTAVTEKAFGTRGTLNRQWREPKPSHSYFCPNASKPLLLKAKLKGNKDFGFFEAKVNVSGAVLGIEQKIRRVIKP